MRDWIKRGAQLPHDRDGRLMKELCATTYTTKNGKIILSPKELIKANLGFSPDHMDALALTFADPEAPGQLSLQGMLLSGKQNTTLHEYDPYADDRL
jgi:hypothetical protein